MADLEQFRTVDLTVNHANGNTFIPKKYASSGDIAGRTTTLQVTDDGVVNELPGIGATAAWYNKASGQTGLDAFEIVDKSKNILVWTYPQSMLTAGTVEVVISIQYQGKSTDLRKFTIEVQQVNGQMAGIVSSEAYKALTEALARVNEYDSDIAKIDYETVKLDTDKASKDELDAAIKSVINLSPQEIFTSLNELKAKYPSGADKLVLVMGSDGKNADVYQYKNGNWSFLTAYTSSDKAFSELVNKNSAYVEQTLRATVLDRSQFNSAGNTARWTFSYVYKKGWIKGAWLRINSDTNVNYEILLIGSTSNTILKKINGTGMNTVVVPVNDFIKEDFYISIICDKFAFTTAESNGVKFSTQAISDTSVGAKVSITWNTTDTKTYNLGLEFLYRSIDDNQKDIQTKLLDVANKSDLNDITKPKASTNIRDFDLLTTGSYWIEKNSTDAANSPLLNAPLDSKYGYYSVQVFDFGVLNSFKFYRQVAHTYSSEKGKGVFSRFLVYTKDGVLDPSNTSIREWLRLDNSNAVIGSESKKELVAAGDSITAGYPYETNTQIAYVNQFARRLGFNVTRSARNGSGLLFVNGNQSATIIAANTDYSKYDVATFAFGTNDYGNNMDLGVFGDLYPAKQTVYGALQYIINTVYSKNPNITLVFIQPINRCDKGTKDANWAYGTKNDKGYTLADVCDAIAKVCEANGVSSIDNRQGSFNKHTIEALLLDKLHPTVEGYKKLGQMYSSKLAALINPYVD